jgi:hypothetical protein
MRRRAERQRQRAALREAGKGRRAVCRGMRRVACGVWWRAAAAAACGGVQRCVMACSGHVRQRAASGSVWRRAAACGVRRAAGSVWRAAGGRWRAAGGRRRAAGGGGRAACGGSDDGDGNVQVAVVCSNVRLFSY